MWSNSCCEQYDSMAPDKLQISGIQRPCCRNPTALYLYGAWREEVLTDVRESNPVLPHQDINCVS
ncbi:hypothetical protein BofuT4_uP102300.1 [Botrytis cinerea T4]|uniref:Uncharacterized protein n=1 Tax=Botryotinia fuckeliana (strain T4) TaxID=999810 RepID=G2YBD8_BOTF4|nr:hypothetical protein BofuT4_uP102300.1 [Botrytis cinerea T4]